MRKPVAAVLVAALPLGAVSAYVPTPIDGNAALTAAAHSTAPASEEDKDKDKDKEKDGGKT